MQTAHAKGEIKIEEVPDDVSGILKVATGRSDYHFMADGMFKFMISSDPRLKEVAEQVQMNARPVARVGWGICFKAEDPESLKIMAAFNSSPARQKFPEVVDAYLKNLMGKSK
jgi:hypothetical protein